MAVEVFANNPSTSVTSGGTDAPSAGTVETWVVGSSASFPAASSSASPPTQFHVADPAVPSDLSTVTNVSGTTWTVTRGAEGTTPVSHTAGFTIEQVVTAGGYTAFLTANSGYATTASPTFTGGPTAPTQTTGDNTTKIATDQFVTTAVAAEASRAGTAEALKAPLASPALTGNPTAPTQTAGDNSTKLATTAYVATAVGGGGGGTATGLASATTTVAVSTATAPSTGQVLTATSSTAATWQNSAAGFSNPMTTLGDIIYEASGPVPARLPGSASARRKALTQTGTGSVSAAPVWYEPATSWVNVIDNGADPTGTSDSTTAFQNAINAAAVFGAGLVYAPTGTHKLTPVSATVPALTIPSGVTLGGDGPGATKLLKNGNGPLLDFSGAGPVSQSSNWNINQGVRDLAINGNSKTGSLYRLYYVQCFTETNVYLHDNADVSVDAAQLWDSRFTNGLYLYGGSASASAISGAQAVTHLIRNSAAPATTLSAGISGTITALPVAALPAALPAGIVQVWNSSAQVQNFTTTGASSGATSIPVSSVAVAHTFVSGDAVNGFGWSNDSSNATVFSGCHWENGLSGAIWVTQGVDSSAQVNNIWFVNSKVEEDLIGYAAPLIQVDPGANGIRIHGLYIYPGSFNTGFSTPVTGIYWHPDYGTLTDVFMGNGGAATISTGIDAGTTSGWHLPVTNVYEWWGTSPTVAGFNGNGGTPYLTNVQIQGTVTTPFTGTYNLINGSAGGSGTVTSASVVTANGFAGTVATATTTPAITLSTSITGLLKGNGTAMSAATSGTDYVTPSGSITGTAAGFTGALVGDVTGTQGATAVGKIQGVAITSAQANLVADLNNATSRSAAATLLPGEETIFTGSTASQTLTLPASPPSSSINTITNTASVAVTLAPGAGATMSNFGTAGSITVPVGYTFAVVYIGTVWYVQSAGPSDFAKNSALGLTNGGTGQITAAAAFNALSPMTTLGDAVYGGTSGAGTRLAGNTTATKKFYTQTGTGTVSAAPGWNTLVSGDIPNNAANTTGTAGNFTGGATLPAYLAPAADALTYGTSVAVNAALGNVFNLTLTASTATIANPTNPVEGQIIRFRLTQGTGGSFTAAWGTAYDFGAVGSAPTLSITAAKVDIISFEYVSSISKWCCLNNGGLGY